MNPSELRMMWMSQYNPERITFEDAASFYTQAPIGLSVMDDISVAQSGAIEMNPMLSIVGGEYGGQATALGALPSGTLITTGAGNDLYGITQVGNLHPLLQQHHPGTAMTAATAAAAFQPTSYSHMIEDDVMEATNSNDSSNQFIHQPYQIDDSSCYDASGALTHDKEIINIDDFVMMNSDSNSFEDNQMNDENLLVEMKSIPNQNIIGRTAKRSISSSSSSLPTNRFDGTTSSTSAITGSATGSISSNNKKARKIEPIKRPGLVLKSPIAYRGNIDPSVIPIQRDGMAVCERCGAIGVKHTFYTKSRRFCSMACARGELHSLVLNQNKYTLQTQGFIGGGHIPQVQGGGHTSNSNQTDVPSNINSGSNNSNHDTNIDNKKNLDFRLTQIKQPTYRFKMTSSNENNTIAINSNGVGIVNNDREDVNESQSQGAVLYRDVLPQDEIPQIPKPERLPSPCPQEETILSVRRKTWEQLHSYDWTPELSKPDFYAAPVTCFSHAPGFDVWDNVDVDMKVEVENTDVDNATNTTSGQAQTPHSFWVATILKICGYKALMRYEGFDDASHDFWVNLCSSEVHSVGWCATRGKPLIPPKSIENKYTDWKDFLVERLSGARTLPSNFYNKISESFKSRFRIGLRLEITDKNRLSQVKLASVVNIVGKRLLLEYYDSKDGFWCHEDSSLIHPVGWATTVGHDLLAPQDYIDRMSGGGEIIEVKDDDATIELFRMNFTFEEYLLENRISGFVEGMKLEAIDPLNLSSICAATVMKVLKFGYIMVRVDSYNPDKNNGDWFCYHEKSPSIFPVGFCERNDITLTPPIGYNPKTFKWNNYLAETNSVAAPEHLFQLLNVVPDHGFKIGMKLECVDIMDPKLVCVATITRVVGRLIRIHFDGWGDEYDQWLDCESPDFYPVGWCVLVNHKLEGPPPVPAPQSVKQTPKTNKKKQRRKKIKTEAGGGTKNVPNRFGAAIKKEIQEQHHQQQNHLNSKPNIKMESMRSEYHDENDGGDDDEGEYDEEYEDDTISRSDASTTPLPISLTPEPGIDHRSSKLLTSGSNSSSTNNTQKSKSTSPAPPTERKATSYINNSSVTNSKYIPRLIDNSPELSNTSSTSTISIPSQQQQHQQQQSNSEILPETWNVYDVSQFLRMNNCTMHCDAFSRHKIDGKRLLELTKDEIITLLGIKIGPALKIFDLIQQLKCKMNPTKSRLLKSNMNKKFL